MSDEIRRYNRQGLIEGWNQQLWSSLDTLVIGDGKLAQHIADALVGTGVGSVTMMGNTKKTGDCSLDGFLTFEGNGSSFVVDAVTGLLSKINRYVDFYGVSWALRGKLIEDFVEEADIVFDASNDVQSKKYLRGYAADHDKFLVTGSTFNYKGAFKVMPSPDDISEFSVFNKKEQDSVASLVIAGLMVEEARKKFMPYEKSEPGPYADVFWYNLCSRARFSKDNDFKIPTGDISHYRILIGGAGALGMPAVIALIDMNPGKLGLLDYEKPDETNLSRQTLYYDCIGKYKAPSLADKLRRMNGSVDLQSHIGKLVREKSGEIEITNEELLAHGYDIALRCFDNFGATVLLNEFGIPAVYGGTSYSTASVSAYVPGVTSCMNCTVQAKTLAEEEIDRDSCDNVLEPSIITTSKIAAGLEAGEAVLIMKGLNDELINGTIEYDLFEPARFAIMQKQDICSCNG